MPTIIGIVFLVASICCWKFGERWLLGLLILSSFFQAASAINFGLSGIQPYYLVACFLIASQMRKPEFWRADVNFAGRKALFGLRIYRDPFSISVSIYL